MCFRIFTFLHFWTFVPETFFFNSAINMKISIFACVLLISAVMISVDGETPAEKFKRQHINKDMDPKRCDAVIKERKIHQNNRAFCKKENTFISASYGEVKKVCEKEGEPYPNDRNLRISLNSFRVVNCKCKDNMRPPNCGCKGSRPNLRIVIACDNNDNPVHYEEGLYITSLNETKLLIPDGSE
ncbi:hypothetical protein EPR50_G00058140 [Perca flavescens]|uniref:Ribonuclease A-domain domain-containing protein n=1 Tax=Perca flavescens TaxID=8167 RepID=A0A484D7B9_PERFV|nr:hypothetical protein EPR50_G00058140 [Perca flavescens]